MKDKKLKILYHVVVPLSIGIMVYTLFRGVYFGDPGKSVFPIFNIHHLPQWIKYNLPDGLWFYSLISSITLVWDDFSSRNFKIWLISAVILVFLSEVSQNFDLVEGTFDPSDIYAYMIAIVVYIRNFKIYPSLF